MTVFWKAQTRTRGWLCAAMVLAIFFLARMTLPEFFRELEYRLYDYRLRVSPKPEPSPEIVLIDIDDQSIEALGQWPWKRSVHARALEVLRQCGVGLVVFDIVFHSPGSGEDDRALSRALSHMKRVILPAGLKLVREDKPVRLKMDERDRALAGSYLDIEVSDITRLFQTERSFVPMAMFCAKSLGVGHIAATPDSDGVFRRLPLIVGFNGEVLPSIDLLAAVKHLGVEKISWSEGEGLRLEGTTTVGGRKGTITIPVDQRGCMLIRYAGKWGQVFDHISFSDVYGAYGDEDKVRELKKDLEGKIACISFTSTGSTDIGPTPLETAEPLSVVHSNAINTILSSSFLREAPRAVNILVALLMAAVIVILSSRLRSTLFVISSLALIISYVAANVLLFSAFSLVLNLGAVTLITLLIFVVLLVNSFILTARESGVQRDVLRSYFSPQIIDQILKSPDKFSLEGSSKDLTVLFSDIVGFTGLSDSLHPAEVQRILREYMDSMIRIIFRHNGAIDKMMGDAIMAFWGYPEAEGKSNEENVRSSALDGVRAAMEMQREMEGLNQRWQSEGRETLRIRIGINTGFVTIGNMGSRDRMEFTLIGGNVNLAQRLERMAPEGGILISNRTYSLVRDEVSARDIGEMELKGIEKPVRVHEVEY